MSMLRTAVPLMILPVFLGISCSSGETTLQETQSAPPAGEASFPPCREDPMAHVHRPTRLEVIENCVSASGTVKDVRFKSHDGDYWVLVDPDPEYTDLLAPSNEGVLLSEVIPTDQPSVFIPEVGQHATFYGTLVADKGHDRWVEIHPTWLITTLDVAIDVPSSVPIGDELGVSVTVNSTFQGTSSPVSLASLFLEMVSEDGETIRWEAAQTNTAGVASLTFTVLESPGDYVLWVYASKDHESGFANATFRIRHR